MVSYAALHHISKCQFSWLRHACKRERAHTCNMQLAICISMHDMLSRRPGHDSWLQLLWRTWKHTCKRLASVFFTSAPDFLNFPQFPHFHLSPYIETYGNTSKIFRWKTHKNCSHCVRHCAYRRMKPRQRSLASIRLCRRISQIEIERRMGERKGWRKEVLEGGTGKVGE